jgi:formate dehydrogenase iron-sulfur subunit
MGSGKASILEVRMGAGAYICGEETSLLESSKASAARCVSSRRCRHLQGLFGKPTVINNVITLASVPIILDRGAEYYQNFGMGRSRGTLPIQLAGNIKHGGLVEVAFGATLRELLYDYGGGSLSGRHSRRPSGRPLGCLLAGIAVRYQIGLRGLRRPSAPCWGTAASWPSTTASTWPAWPATPWNSAPIESCGKCTPCRIGSTRGVEVIDRLLTGDNAAKQETLLRDLCDTMTYGSLCALGGMTPFPVLSALNHFPEDFVKPARQTPA